MSNLSNKQRFVDILKTFLENCGFSCLASVADADVLICETAMNLYKNKQHVTVVGDDIDLFVILLHRIHVNEQSSSGLFFSTKTCVYDVNAVKNQLGHPVVSMILLIHAFTGCDTTSRILGIGKDKLQKLHAKIDETISVAFYSSTSSKESIKKGGEQLFLILLNIPMGSQTLDSARLTLFNTMVVKNSKVIDCSSLPPTSSAAEQHSFRVYHQIQTWMGNEMDPTEWGWKFVNNKHVPLTTTLSAAPEKLLAIIHCGCKTVCKTKQCSCVKAGIGCGPGCVNCIEICNNK